VTAARSITLLPSTRSVLHEDVLAGLETVRDPELDQPLTELGFVSACSATEAGEVVVRLRLPTYFCAPNFAFLMVADAYDAIASVPGVRRVRVILEDHFASDQINDGVAARAGFHDTFAGQAVDELDELRRDFLIKAALAGTDRVCRPLLSGRSPAEVVALRLGDAADTPDRERLRARRLELGLPAGDDDPLLVDPHTGLGLEVDALPAHLARARLTRVSLEANAGVCRGMLHDRYATIGVGEKEE
jgi:metal-sulfur cluster biosynthetic enzyme